MAKYTTNTNNINSSSSASLNGQTVAAASNRLTLDKFSTWYTYENQITLGFPLLDKYSNLLTATLYEIELDPAYIYRPEYLSYNLFGTTDLWYIIMYVNKLTKVTDFVGPTVLVPSTAIIQTINTIITQEEDMAGGKDSAINIKKNYLKQLSKPSTEVLRKMDDERVAWFQVPNMTSKLEQLVATIGWYQGTYTSNRGWLRDLNDNLIPAISLTTTGGTSIATAGASTYTQTLLGRINLKANVPYSWNTYYNGRGKVEITDPATAVKVTDLDVTYTYPEAMLLADMRSATLEEGISSDIGAISYDAYVAGAYTTYINSSALSVSTTNLVFANTLFTAGNEDPILDANRLTGSKNLFFNLEYLADFSDSKITKHTYTVKVTYTDGTSTSKVLNPIQAKTSTNGEVAYLKGSMPMSSGKKVANVSAAINITLASGTASVALKYALYSFEVTPVADVDLMHPFVVSESKWYDLRITYIYNLVDPLTNVKNYKDLSFAGVYFNPSITETTTTNVINHLLPADIQDTGKTTPGSPVSLTFPITAGATGAYREIMARGIELPKSFIMDLNLIHKTPSTGGGVGFVFNYDEVAKTGYMVWITSNPGSSNSALPAFSEDGSANILQSGFYELDPTLGEKKQVFSGDNSLTFTVNNYKPLDLTGGRNLRIMKRDNRIKFFTSTSGVTTFNMSTPVLDVEDIENVRTGGSIGLYAVYAQVGLDVLDYITWDSTTNYTDEQW